MVLKTNGDDKIVEPSREFLDAVNSLRKDLGDCTRKELELEQEKNKRIYHLGLKDGLSAELITKKVEERHFVQTHCRECNLPVFGYKYTTIQLQKVE